MEPVLSCCGTQLDRNCPEPQQRLQERANLDIFQYFAQVQILPDKLLSLKSVPAIEAG